MLALELVQTQRSLDRDQHLLRDVAYPALLELDVVVDADPSQNGDLLAPQPLDPPVRVRRRQADLLRGQRRPPGGEKVAQLATSAHAPIMRRAERRFVAEGGSLGTRKSRTRKSR